MTVYCLFRQRPDYPWKEVKKGIEHHGEKVEMGYNNVPLSRKDSLLTWNKYGIAKRLGLKVQQIGGLHLVFENAYIVPEQGWYAVGINGVNGEDQSFVEEKESNRWKNLQLKIHPWNKNGKHILVCGQRGGDYNCLSMPLFWPTKVLKKIRSITDRPILYRSHPHRLRMPACLPINCSISDGTQPLLVDLKEAFVCIVWTSSAALTALLMGIPVIYCGPSHIAKSIASDNLKSMESPYYASHRFEFFTELAWRQFHLSELANGFMWEIMVKRWQLQG